MDWLIYCVSYAPIRAVNPPDYPRGLHACPPEWLRILLATLRFRSTIWIEPYASIPPYSATVLNAKR